MKKRILIGTWLVCFHSALVFSQHAVSYSWWNPAQSEFPVIEGQAWTKEVEKPYDRLPARAEKTVRDAVWNLSRQSAGLLIRFRSNAAQMVIRYTVGGRHAMPHMPATGVSGIDLYAVNSDGDLLWCAGKYSFEDTIEFRFNGLEPNDPYHEQGREYRLYLPLYNAVQWLEIGVPDQAIFTPLATRMEKPVVVYGTSIAQGACASRPGMAWTSILERKLDRPVINLGFSGNGMLEKELIDLLVEIDAKIYVLDCLPNMTATSGIAAEEVKNRIIASVKQIQQKREGVPVLLVEHAGYADGKINPLRRGHYTDVNRTMREAFAQLKSEGIQHIYLLPMEEINQGMDDTVDGVHPTDLGMLHYADAYEKYIRRILNEPTGVYATTKPCTQYREPGNYDWEARHRTLLALNKTKPPEIIFLGNSITHYWGGQPKAPISRGSSSWNKFFEPLGVRNFGFGWDRVENVLWRVYHDELDGYQAAQVILLIGTNNFMNSDEEILEGLELLVQAIKLRQPEAEILLLGLLPRREQEQRVTELNLGISRLSGRQDIGYADIGKPLLNKDGTINESLFTDGLHPNEAGYQKLAQQITPYLKPRL